MAAAENEDSWLHHNRRREERMRYEVLAALYGECARVPGCAVHFSRFAHELGAWREELFRAVEWLDRKGYVVYHGAGPVVSITEKGTAYIEREAGKRRSIRD